MLDSKIAQRLLGSFLTLSFLGLTLLGVLLTSYFHKTNLDNEKQKLLNEAKIVSLMLDDDIDSTNQEQMNKNIRKIYEQTNLRITVLDENGAVVADSNGDAEDMDNHIDRPEIQSAFLDQYGTAVRYSHTLKQNMLYIAIPYSTQGRFSGIIRTSTSLQSIEESFQHTITVCVMALVFLFLISIIFAMYLAHRQIQPIMEITRTAHAIMTGQYDGQIHVKTGDEFDILVHTINQLTQRLSHKITEEKTENQKLNLILNHMDNGVILLDENGKIIDANRQACELFRLTPANFFHHSIHVLGSAIISDTSQRVLEGENPINITITLPVPDHPPRTFNIFFSCVTSEGKKAVIAVFHDISLMKEMSERQSAFVSNAAHELRTPLTSINGFAEFLLDDDFSNPEESRHCAAVILKEGQRMDRLITSLLELAKLDSNHMREQLEKGPVSPGKVLEEAAEELREKAEAKNQQIDLHIETRAMVLAKRDLFRQILHNLIDNAIKYTPQGGHIRLSCKEKYQRVVLQIQDDGIGIDAANLPYIFDRFYRVDKARARKSGGNGIGLSLVKFLVEFFDGTIHVASTLGKGTCFTLSFPVHRE